MADQDLLIRLRLDNQQAIAGAKGFERALRGVNQQTIAYGAASKGAAQQTGALGVSTRQLRSSLGQAGYQVADLAIVLTSGQNAMQALAIQGGQLAGAFGPTGAMAGALITVGGLLAYIASQALSTSESIKDLQDATKEATDAISAWRDAVDQQGLTLDDIKEEFDVTTQVYRALTEAITSDKARQAEEFIAALSDTKALRRAIRDLEKFTHLLGLSREEIADQFGQRTLDLFDEYTRRFEALPAEVQSAITAIREFNRAMESGNPRAQAEAMEDVALALQQMSDETPGIVALRAEWAKLTLEMSQLTKTMPTLSEAVIALAADLGTLATAALSWGDNMWTSARNAWSSLQELARARMAYERQVGSGRGGSPFDFASKDEIFNRGLVREEPFQPSTTKRGGGGGGSKLSEEAKAAAKAQEELAERTKEVAEQVRELEDAGKSAFYETLIGGIDGFVDTLYSAEKDFKAFATSLLNELGKIIAKQILMTALMTAFGGRPGAPANAFQGAIQDYVGITSRISANARFAKGGVLDSPTYVPNGSGMALAGEAGKEAVVPLARDGNGNLGVGASPVNIRVENYGGSQIGIEERNGEIAVIVDRARSAVEADFARSMQTGQGTYSRAIEKGFTTRRRAT